MDVSPEKQNIDSIFSSRTFFIDFYQRQYKWTDEPVKRLLDDVLYKFNLEYEKYRDLSVPQDQMKNVINKYGWYYLNTIVTNSVNGKLFLVDGQQRLTTLTLILMKLRNLAMNFQSPLADWISRKIVGLSGYNVDFWMHHEDCKNTMQELYDGNKIPTTVIESSISAKNMRLNYETIQRRLNAELPDRQKYELFVFYFMYRLVLIELIVEQTDVPMVFEVINDRGVRLKPYEILKGKLLGQISKEELDRLQFNELWDERVASINAYEEDEIDQFFTYYLRAKYADSIGDSKKFDRDYHRVMFSDNRLRLEHSPHGVKEFLLNDFKYYSGLYVRILKELREDGTTKNEHLYFNKLNRMDMQFLLILSSCNLDDVEEVEKIRIVAYEMDRLFCLLQVQRSYDSNRFSEAMYSLSAEIRHKPLANIRPAFEETLLDLLADARGVETTTSLSYGFFKEVGIELDKHFKRYFFARIEKFIAENTRMQMKQTLYNLVQNTGPKNGFHIEHILAENSENLELFAGDEERFKSERNRLGGLLLLKGLDNLSSNDETYDKKLESYANTLFWNETLREDSYKSKLDFRHMMTQYNLNFRPMDKFGPEELEERQKLLFDMVSIIWN